MEGGSIDLPSQPSLTYRGIADHCKNLHDAFSTQPVGTPWQLSKQIIKISSRMNVLANPILDQTEEERKAFSLRVQQGRPYRDITPKTTWLLSKIKKSLLL